ncbi:MAG: Adenine-specific methyltransferase [Nitrospira sp.]|nr:MAG: Adenine-specific methyltransferase [Nitrospira sp.]
MAGVTPTLRVDSESYLSDEALSERSTRQITFLSRAGRKPGLLLGIDGAMNTSYIQRLRQGSLIDLRTLKSRTPWWVKMAGRIAPSRLPCGYNFWHRLGVFEHGRMEDPSYAFQVFTRHFNKVRATKRPEEIVALELGPGDSLFSAVIASAVGVSASYLIDVGDFAVKDLKKYAEMASFVRRQGLPAPPVERVTSIGDLLPLCRATYGSSGLSSLRAIPSRSVDFIWSQAVLQSVRRAELLDTMRELRRVLKDDGLCSHVVDLSDLFVKELHHLRFRDSIWESDAVARCGFYANRLRYSDMLTVFRRAGFKVTVVAVKRWDEVPIPRRKLVLPFRTMPEEELRVFGFEVTLLPA